MLSQKSIRKRFIVRLVVASVALVGIFSVTLYIYIRCTVYKDLYASMKQKAYLVSQSQSLYGTNYIESEYLQPLRYDIVQVNEENAKKLNQFFVYQEKDKEFLTFYYPLEQYPDNLIIIYQEISSSKEFLRKILRNIFFANINSLIAIMLTAYILSSMMIKPIESLAKTLAKQDERNLNLMDTNELHEEFVPLGLSVNRLLKRIQSFIKYRSEFYIGVAHELKTPLAVMKTKNEVSLMKSRDEEYYKQTLEQNIKSINEMNEMINTILKIGRQGGDQLKPLEIVDLVSFIKDKARGFKILAQQEKKELILDIKPSSYCMLVQPNLVLHILQNFIQNAIKFSPLNSSVTMRTRRDEKGFLIEVLDEGCGIDENIDIFVPFRRVGEKAGAGLGLYLANQAAKALNADISVKNRSDLKGTIASLYIPKQVSL